MWTRKDNDLSVKDGWWIYEKGLTGFKKPFPDIDTDLRKYIKQRAAEGSDLHIRAFQHIALCKLLNISPAPKD